ncbi:protein of unknown function [Xenorhabdus doucetiae]|uniref:Uncharacterized protein n=1 Tax=Xenorhabdus doucetiae TaxID=351671 RepID=A0A068QV19_9GAMM|nr:protein of unknown function [Xenorhabdus doucetiae]
MQITAKKIANRCNQKKACAKQAQNTAKIKIPGGDLEPSRISSKTGDESP